jgi:hypothetical protein
MDANVDVADTGRAGTPERLDRSEFSVNHRFRASQRRSGVPIGPTTGICSTRCAAFASIHMCPSRRRSRMAREWRNADAARLSTG